MGSLEVEVSQGTVEVQYIDTLHETDDIYVLEIGTIQKHPELGGYCSGVLMTLWPEQHPDHLKDSEPDFITTIVKFKGLDGNWQQVMDVDRYHVNVVLFRSDEEKRKSLWTSTLG